MPLRQQRKWNPAECSDLCPLPPAVPVPGDTIAPQWKFNQEMNPDEEQPLSCPSPAGLLIDLLIWRRSLKHVWIKSASVLEGDLKRSSTLFSPNVSGIVVLFLLSECSDLITLSGLLMGGGCISCHLVTLAKEVLHLDGPCSVPLFGLYPIKYNRT